MCRTCSIPEPASISEQASSVSVTQGDPARLECRFSGTKPLRCRWMKAGQELTSGRRFRVQRSDCSSVLCLSDTELRDSFQVSNASGCSSCEAAVTILGPFIQRFYNSNQSISCIQAAEHCSCTLHVLDQMFPPSFTRGLTEIEAIRGLFAHLECLVSG